MTRQEALKFWEWRYENAKDYYDVHWEADERRSHREYVQALEWAVKALADRKTEPQTCETCKWGEWYRKGYDITMMSDECGGCCSWNNKWTPKDEPQTDCSWK